MCKKKIIGVLVGLVLTVSVMSSAQALTVQGRLRYFDSGSGRDEPIRWAKVEIWREWCDFLGICVWTHDYDSGTDGDGWFSTQDVYFRDIRWAIRVVAENSAIRVNTFPLYQPFWRDPGIKIRPSSDFDVLDFTFTFVEEDACRHFNIFSTVPYGFDYANAYRDPSTTVDRVAAILDTIIPNSFYDPVTHTLHIRPESAFDDLVLLHEYAHFLEHNISTFAPIISTHDGCRATDILGNIINSPEHAWMEGFADYFARSVEHFLPAGTLAGFGSPNQWTLESPGCVGPGTNDAIELWVAGVLWDLFDAPGDPGTVPEAFDTYYRDKNDIAHAIFMIFDLELGNLGGWPTIYDFHDAFVNRWPWEHDPFDRLLCGNGIPLGHSAATEVCNGFDDDCDGQIDEGVNCDDGDPCTIDSCVNGQCIHQPINCDDGDPCTTDSCVNGQCVHQPINCDDGDPCTIDSCVNGQCVHQSYCDDGDPCTIDICGFRGVCFHFPIDCDDGDPCTIDSCVNGQCVHQPINCDDDNPCTIDSCVNGQCVHEPINCDDGNPCTIDSCVNGQCQHQPDPTCLAVHNEPWTTAGSTGTVDDADVSIAVFSGPTVTVSGSVAVATLDMRYNIVPIDGLLNSSGAIRLKVRFRDNGPSAQVIVKLVRFNPLTAATATMMTFDSNNYAASSSFQTRSINTCPSRISFDFFTRVYYIEVALKKYSSTGAPGLSGIALDFTKCP